MSRSATAITLASRPKGEPVPGNFEQKTLELPDPGEGELLVRVIWLSLDPYMRGRMDDAKSYADPVAIGDVMGGGGVAEVLVSKHDSYAEGDIVTGDLGWTSHAVVLGGDLRKLDPAIAPVSTALGVLGMPGMTAWAGLNEILQAKEGETILVSAATGAVGGLVGQLAKAKGMRVLGVAGGAEKCAYATETLGYDACFDHYAPDARELRKQIAGAAPDGVDCYFENVGGKTLEAVTPVLNTYGRIALCGMIAWYSGAGVAEAMPLPKMWRTILTQRLRVQGFIVTDHFDRFGDFLREVAPMVGDGRVAVKEDVTEGLENAPAAFTRMLGGGNFGKTLVRVGPDP